MLNRTTAAVAMLAAPIAVLAGCSNSQTGNDQAAETSTTSEAGSQTIKVELKTADGTAVANATIDFTGGFATVTVDTTGNSKLSRAATECTSILWANARRTRSPRPAVRLGISTRPAAIYRSEGAPNIRRAAT